MYDDRYFSGEGEWVGGYWQGSYVANETNLRQEAREALPLLGKSHGRLLEIGCAGGFFLAEARAAGFEVQGVELNETMAAHARNLGLEVQCAPIEAADLPLNSFDVVIAQDVLEHLRDVQTFVRRAAELLAPGGILVIRGPLEDSLAHALFAHARTLTGRQRIVAEPPLHLHGFTVRSFRQLLAHSGFSIRQLEVRTYRAPVASLRPKELAGAAIELFGYWVDQLRGRGAFLEASAVLET